MSLTPDQKQFYQNTLSVTKKEISELEDLIQQELAKVKDRLNELQNAQKAARQMYDAACQRLGIPNELEEAESRQG
jgi:ABC-type Zn uptake system ZnuABC Zn-binding protein ZnuA